MPLRTRSIGGLLGLLLLAVKPVYAQSFPVEERPIAGVLQGAVRLADATVRKGCPPLVTKATMPDEVTSRGKALKSWCTVDTVYKQPVADFTRWLAAVYTRHVEVAADSFRRKDLHFTRDTAHAVTAVLYSWTDGALPWKPEWTATVPREVTRSVEPSVAPRPDKSAFASIRYCINGTGGCWQHYLHRRDQKWTEVVETFWKQLTPIENGRIATGPGIDVATLTGSFAVYAPEDANCCASRIVEVALELRRDSLVLKRQVLKRADPPRD